MELPDPCCIQAAILNPTHPYIEVLPYFLIISEVTENQNAWKHTIMHIGIVNSNGKNLNFTLSCLLLHDQFSAMPMHIEALLPAICCPFAKQFNLTDFIKINCVPKNYVCNVVWSWWAQIDNLWNISTSS